MSYKDIGNRPLYPIGIVAEMLDLHPQTIRVWEKYGVIQPQKRSTKRFYSNNDLKRLRFVQKLREKGLNKAAVSHHINSYLCWNHANCPPCVQRSEHNNCGKPCWRDDGVYCISSYSEDLCSHCEFYNQ